jgi:hypothetical protein
MNHNLNTTILEWMTIEMFWVIVWKWKHKLFYVKINENEKKLLEANVERSAWKKEILIKLMWMSLHEKKTKCQGIEPCNR